MKYPFIEKMKSCIASLKINLRSLISSKKRTNVIKLLYQYRHLNSENLTNLLITNLIMHRITMKSETKSHFVNQKRWSSHMKWWMKKLVQDEIEDEVYERTNRITEQLSSWNARAVLMNKMKNSISNDESRMTFNYSRVIEKLSDIHMQLMSECHDYLSNLRHECFMIADLKHAYFMMYIHSNDRKYFAFIISELDQLQFTRMHQESMTASFIMSELMCRALEKFSNESSLLQSDSSNCSSSLTFYQDDILEEHRSFDHQFAFLRDHFFSRMKWAHFKLAFKKLYLFQSSIKALEIRHHVEERMQILKIRVEKIMKFSVLIDKTDVRAFLSIIELTHRWISNFSKINRSLTRLIDKVNWRWTISEQLSFEILKIKYIVVTHMHEYDYFLSTHFYIDVFLYDVDLIITQFHIIDEKIVEVFILYDFFIFSSAERKYSIYKKELCALIKFVLKYDYVGFYWLTKEWIATAVYLKWMRNSAYYIKNLSHSSIYWFSSSDSSRFIWESRSSFVTRIFSSDQDIFVLRCHFDLISSESHIHLRTHWSLDNLENQ
jgi:hypothetical protein